MDLLNELLQALSAPEHPAGDEGVRALRELLTGTDLSTLAELREAALAAFEDAYDDDAVPTADELASLEQLSLVVEAAGAEITVREEAGQAARQRAAELAERTRAAQPADPDGDDGQDDGEEPVPAPPELVTASAHPPSNTSSTVGRREGRVSFAGLPHNVPATRSGARLEMSVAADVPNFSQGARIDNIGTLVQATQNRFAAMPKGVPNTRVEVGLAQIRRQQPEGELFETFGDTRDVATMERACDESRLPGGSLVAAGTWCGAPEIDFTLCPSLATMTGMVTLPGVTVRRAGITLPIWQDWQTVAASVTGQILCPPNLNTAKTCIEAPCPTWETFEPCAVPLCVTNDILAERSYPEATARFLQDVQVAQALMVNRYILQQMVGLVDDTVAAGNTITVPGATHSLFDEVSLLIEWFRDLYATSEDQTVEMLAPSWLPAVLRADARKRQADGGDWTRAQVNSRLAALGAVPQWVRGWQPLAAGTGGPPPVFNPPSDWPATVDVLLFPAGTYAVGRDEIINLNAVYDSVLLKTNKYTALFVEEQVTIVKRCSRALKVTINLCANGAMGPALDACAAPAGP